MRPGSALIEQMKAGAPSLIVLEATGGLEVALVSALATAALPGVVVNPRQVRDFAKATGQLAKSDALDADTLAHFGEVIRPSVRPIKDAELQALQALIARRCCRYHHRNLCRRPERSVFGQCCRQPRGHAQAADALA